MNHKRNNRVMSAMMSINPETRVRAVMALIRGLLTNMGSLLSGLLFRPSIWIQ